MSGRPRKYRTKSTVLAAALVGAWPAQTRAQRAWSAAPPAGVGPSFELQWSAPPGCPKSKTVRAATRELVAPSAGDPPKTAAPVIATITAVEPGFALDLSIGQQRRRFTTARCEDLVDVAALVIAVALDPVGSAGVVIPRVQARARPPGPGGSARSDPATTLVHSRPDDPASTTGVLSTATEGGEGSENRSPGVQVGLRPEVGVGGAVLPGAGLGFGVALAVLARRVRGEAWVAHWLERFSAVDGAVGGRVRLTVAGLRACGQPGVKRVEFPLCAGFEAGSMSGGAEGPGIALGRASGAWVGFNAGAGVAWVPVPLMALTARAEAVVGLRRPAFHLDGFGRVHRAAPVGVRGFLGAELRFGRRSGAERGGG